MIVFRKNDAEGVIVRFYRERGFGFINMGGPTDAFFHVRDMAAAGYTKEDVQKGLAVEFAYQVRFHPEKEGQVEKRSDLVRLETTAVHWIGQRTLPKELRHCVDHYGEHYVVRVSWPRNLKLKPKYEVRLGGVEGELVKSNLTKSVACCQARAMHQERLLKMPTAA